MFSRDQISSYQDKKRESALLYQKNTQKQLNTLHRLQSPEWVAQLPILDICPVVFPLSHWLSILQLHSLTSCVWQRQRTHCSSVHQVVGPDRAKNKTTERTNWSPFPLCQWYLLQECENPFEISALQWRHSKVNWTDYSQRMWLMIEIICLSTFLT